MSDTPALKPDGGSVVDRGRPVDSLTDRYDPDLDALEGIYGGRERAAVGDRHVVNAFDLDTDEVTDLIEQYESAGISPTSFVESQRVVSDALVDAVFERLHEELGPNAADALAEGRADLREGLRTASDVATVGVEAFDDHQGAGGAEQGRDVPAGNRTSELDFHSVLHHVGTPLFVLDPDGEILTWNAQLEQLTGVGEAEAMEMEMASMAFYPDGRRGKTLADKVLDAPERTHETYDVPKVEDASFTLYRDTSVMVDQNDDEVHISFSAAPIYGDDGDLLGVVEMVQDRTDDVLRHEATTDLVTELEETMNAIQSGDLAARAEFANRDDQVDESLLDVVDELNAMADSLASLIDKVDGNADAIAAATDQSSDAAATIERNVVEQNEILAEATDDIQDVSASMQEIAATSNQVAAAASRAKEAAESGASAGERAQTVTEDLTDTSDELVDSVNRLEERMDEVNEIIDIIADVADQTNMLALNANIEAARAGESGSGFAVVADEVKTLANETSEYAERISSNVNDVQEQATETVGMVENSNDQILRAEDQITEALEDLDEISEAVEETATGIEEVAKANDGQATAIEGVTTTIEDARSRADDAEAAARQIVEVTDSQTETVTELVESVERLYNDQDSR